MIVDNICLVKGEGSHVNFRELLKKEVFSNQEGILTIHLNTAPDHALAPGKTKKFLEIYYLIFVHRMVE